MTATPNHAPASSGRSIISPAHWLAVPGCALVSIIFLSAGVMKLTHLSAMAEQVHISPALLACAGCVEVLGGISLLVGLWSRIGAVMLFLFLIPTTLMFHHFWTETNMMQQQDQMSHFLKNLAIMGGLLVIAAYGSGPASIDRAKAV